MVIIVIVYKTMIFNFTNHNSIDNRKLNLLQDSFRF